jgi:hypothetical protein
MSYHIPQVGEHVIFVDSQQQASEHLVASVEDASSGVILIADKAEPLSNMSLPEDKKTPAIKAMVRYVDPAGSAEYEGMSWHYPGDDISRIGEEVEVKPADAPEYAKRTIQARRLGG